MFIPKLPKEQDDSKQVWFVRATLPVSKFGKLLELLDREGINRASLMPNYDQVVKTIEMRYNIKKIP